MAEPAGGGTAPSTAPPPAPSDLDGPTEASDAHPVADITWKRTNGTGQSFEGFTPGPGDGYLTASVIQYGPYWRAYVQWKPIDSTRWASADEAMRAVEAHLDASR